MSGGLPHAAGSKFEARFDGRCKGCDTAVYAGDMMQYIDDEAVCADCGDAAVAANHEAVRANAERWRAEERAKDPEKFDRHAAAVKAWVDSVKASAAAQPGKEWVRSPAGDGWVKVPPEDQATPPLEQEDPMPVEAGIQALMAAGLLQGQEPGGSGVCNAEIITADGKVTEVAIPVPVDPPAAKAPRKRASRAKPKPEAPAAEVPSTASVEDAAAAALARVRTNTPVQNMVEGLVNPETQAVIDGRLAADDVTDPYYRAARLAEIEANAKDWDPAAIAAEVNPPTAAVQMAQDDAAMAVMATQEANRPDAPAPIQDTNLPSGEGPPGALQASLQAAVDAGLMTAHDAAALGWVPPSLLDVYAGALQPGGAYADVNQWADPGEVDAYMRTHTDPTRPGASYVPGVSVEDVFRANVAEVTVVEAMAVQDEARSIADSPIYSPATGPRTSDALVNFKANYDNPAADIFIDALAAAKSAPEEDAILGALDSLAPYGGPVDVEEAKRSILGVIEDAITNHPRSLQKTIGPSEIGTECDHCLAAKLAGWEQVREGGAWLPTVGTAVHTWIEEKAFRRVMLDAFGRPRYLMERKVAVGTIGGVKITGSTDLVDLVRGMTWDWKIVGATTLKSAKASPSQRYIIQQMLYARGWRRLGVLITHVGIAYLPRNDVSLRKAVLWTAPYDEALAVAALERADALDRNLKAMESISVEVRDQYISGLPRWRSWRAVDSVSGVEKLVKGNALEGQIECLDCARYPDFPKDAAVAEKQLEGLLA